MIVYLDANCVIYFVERNPVWWPRIKARVATLRAVGDELAVSDLTRTECLVGPLLSGDAIILASYQAFFSDPAIHVLPLTAAVCERAAHVRAAYRFKVPDALHLAAALEQGCGLFLTNDAQLVVLHRDPRRDSQLTEGPAFPQDDTADAELWAGLPFVQMAVVGPEEFELYVEQLYATDRYGHPKGMIENNPMSIESRRELEVTRANLKLLEERLAALRQAPAENRRAQEWSVRSLTQTINQLKEEIARFESRAGSPAPNL